MSLYVNRIRAGHIKPETAVTVVADNGSTMLLDGGLGLGQIVGIRATDLSVERARQHGLAAVAVRELTHLGALGFYTHRAAEQGVISLVVQNGPAFVPPYGGVTGLFSTNPFSYAFPASEEEPVVFDIATTAVAGNKILLAKKARRSRDPRRMGQRHPRPPDDGHRGGIDRPPAVVRRPQGLRHRVLRRGDGRGARQQQLRSHRAHRVAGAR